MSARAHSVALSIEGGVLRIDGDGLSVRVLLGRIRWPERTRHGPRLVHLDGGATVQALDAADWDDWTRTAGVADAWIVAAQQSWQRTGAALLVLVALAVVGFRWGVPWMARAALAALPAAADRRLGDAALTSMNGVLLLPSQLPAARQAALRRAFDEALQHGRDSAECPGCALEFHASPHRGRSGQTRLGPNAFALPGGTIVVTDDLVDLLQGRDDVLLGVLGHEAGHVRRRHGMRMVVQATVVGAVASLLWGDVSSVLAAAPALLGQSAYSRDFEREADADAVALLRANGVSPAVMADLFARLAAFRRARQSDPAATAFDLPIAFASHPADEERVRYFRAAAASR